MKIIIAGDGKMGATLTRQLSAEGYDLTVIDFNSKVLESSEERYDVMVVQGNCASMDVLRQAGVKEADLMIAVVGADEVNLLCCVTAHRMNPRLHTIARVRNPEYTDQIYEMRDMFAGICIKEFVVFFGERLRYYITEESEKGSQPTRSNSISASDLEQDDFESRFTVLNDIMIGKTLHDYDTVNDLLLQYYRQEFVVDSLFKLR